MSKESTSNSVSHAKKSQLSDELHDGKIIMSLITLNGHCILEIFKYVDIRTLCRLADVCKRFRSLAELEHQRRKRQNDCYIHRDMFFYLIN